MSCFDSIKRIIKDYQGDMRIDVRSAILLTRDSLGYNINITTDCVYLGEYELHRDEISKKETDQLRQLIYDKNESNKKALRDMYIETLLTI